MKMWLLIGAMVLFYFLIRMLGAVVARVIATVLRAGHRAIMRTPNEETDQIVAVPLVLTTQATVAEIVSALDAIVPAQKQTPGLSKVLYESGRGEDHIEYSHGSKAFPQELVAEVRFIELDGATQTVFKTLHVTERGGVRPSASVLKMLKEAVEYTIGAVGNPEMTAEGVRLYGPPEPGSERNVLAKRRKAISNFGYVAAAAAVAWLAIGVEVRLLPVWLLLLSLGGALLTYPERIADLRWNRRYLAVAATAATAIAIVVGGVELWSATRHQDEVGFVNDTPEPGEEMVAEQVPTETPEEQPADDTEAFVQYVVGQGGVVTINASDDPDSDNASAVLRIMTSAEPYLEWTVPLTEATEYAIGDRKTEAWETCDYVRQQDGALIDVICGGDRVTSITVHTAADSKGEEALRTNRGMMLSELIYDAPADGGTVEVDVTFSGEASSKDDDSVWFEIRYDTYIQPVDGDATELGACYVDGAEVSQDEFLARVCASSETKGGMEYNKDEIVRSWVETD